MTTFLQELEKSSLHNIPYSSRLYFTSEEDNHKPAYAIEILIIIRFYNVNNTIFFNCSLYGSQCLSNIIFPFFMRRRLHCNITNNMYPEVKMNLLDRLIYIIVINICI